jgi:hypothetical protein
MVGQSGISNARVAEYPKNSAGTLIDVRFAGVEVRFAQVLLGFEGEFSAGCVRCLNFECSRVFGVAVTCSGMAVRRFFDVQK